MKAFAGSIEKRGESYRAVIRICGRKQTATFPTHNLARAWLMDINRGVETLSLDQQRDAARAYTILPKGVTLTECVTHYLATAQTAPSALLKDLADEFISARKNDLRSTTLENYRRVLNNAIVRFDTLADITPEALRHWTSSMTAHNKNRSIRALSSFFGWCIEHGHASTNPTENIRLAKVDAPKREVLTLAQTKHLLDTVATTAPRLMPYFAICLFAGVRPDECKQLTPSHLTRDYIRIDESIAKTHAARTIPIPANLRDLLNRYPIDSKGVNLGLSYDRLKKNISAVIKASGIKWANDIMRHSYASYEYERTKDAAATAANMGHTSTDMLFRHYRGLVEPNTGNQYFEITVKH